MTVNTRVIRLILRNHNMSSIPLQDGLRLQILPNIAYLPTCQKHHFAAFIRDTSLLIAWDDSPKNLLDRVRHIEHQLMARIWQDDTLEEKSEKTSHVNTATASLDGTELDMSSEDLATEKPRKTVLIQAILTGITLLLIIAALGAGWRQIAIETFVDKSMMRLVFFAVVPLQIWLALVCFSISSRFRWTNIRRIVLHAVDCWLYSPADWTNQSND